MKKTGLFFGSFNPIHIGHLIIAGYMQQYTDLEEVWFVVSPHNPLKEIVDLLDEQDRFEMVKIAIENNPVFRASDIEFGMPRPSYTIDTLKKLEGEHPDRKFVIIAGTDIFREFHRWKNYRLLLKNYHFYIYPRPGFDPAEYKRHYAVLTIDAPLLEISSSFIRQSIRIEKDVRYMLPEKVWKYVQVKGFYR